MNAITPKILCCTEDLSNLNSIYYISAYFDECLLSSNSTPCAIQGKFFGVLHMMHILLYLTIHQNLHRFQLYAVQAQIDSILFIQSSFKYSFTALILLQLHLRRKVSLNTSTHLLDYLQGTYDWTSIFKDLHLDIFHHPSFLHGV